MSIHGLVCYLSVEALELAQLVKVDLNVGPFSKDFSYYLERIVKALLSLRLINSAKL